MIDLSNCYIARVKTFLGLRSIDPPVPFDEFLEKNINKLKSLIDNNLIIVIDKQGNEVDRILWEDYIVDFYTNDGKPLDAYQDKELTQELIEEPDVIERLQRQGRRLEADPEPEAEIEAEANAQNPGQDIQEQLDLIVRIDDEENAKIAHKNQILKSLKKSDPLNKEVLEKGLERTNQKIEELQIERKKILTRINQTIASHEKNS